MCYQPDEPELDDEERQVLRNMLPKVPEGEEPWKVVRTDNFNREGPGYDDKVIETDLTEKMAKGMAELLNKPLSSSSRDFYVARPMSQPDQIFTP